MSIRLLLAATFALMLVLAAPVRGDFFKALVRDFQEVNQWPCPYHCWDREAVRSAFPSMIQSGWRRQNLLSDSHFTANNGELSPAGQFKVRWILTEVPPEHRVIQVRRGETPEQTAARIQAVQKYAAKIAPDSEPPAIEETNMSPPGYPAGWPGPKDGSTTRKFQPQIPQNLYLPDRNSSGSGTAQ